jgi:hypothetical protein
MALEIVEELIPVRRQMVIFEIAQREGKAVVDAHQRRHLLGQPLRQPLGDAAPRPVFARAGRRQHFGGGSLMRGQIDA